MDEIKPVVDPSATATTQPIAPVGEDLEAKVATLEAEKAALAVERDNYKTATLSLKKKVKEGNLDPEDSDEERMTVIAKQALADSRLADIAREQDDIIKKALKENKELKLAQMNKTNSTPPAAMGSHSESVPVRDTMISPEQMANFKARGWDEKTIERYKKNLMKNAR